MTGLQGYLLFLFIVFYGTIQDSVADEAIGFSYSENNVKLFEISRNTAGCYADLNSYPHWCLGNLSRCQDGITVRAWIKPETAVTPEQHREIILTSGGHLSSVENGFFIERKFGFQYRVGIVFEDSMWKVDFLLEHGDWVNIEFTWSLSSGLDVRVDGFKAGTVGTNDVVSREGGWGRGGADGFESYASSLVVGLGSDNQPVTSQECTYDVKHVSVLNRVTTYDKGQVDEEFAHLLFRGCVRNSTWSPDGSTTDDSITKCRSSCYMDDIKHFNKYAIFDGDACSCVDDISSLDLSHDDCVNNKWRVYSVSGVRDGNHIESSDILLTIWNVSLSQSPYTKPGEDVLIYARINYDVGNDAIYRFEFDDGIVITTTSSPVTHAWVLPGDHKVMVSVHIGIVTVTDHIFVSILDVDEGTAPDYITLTMTHLEEDNKVLCNVQVFDEHKTDCSVYFGDGTSSTLNSVEIFGGLVNADHQYDTFGQFNVKTFCSNVYGTTTTSQKFISRTLTPSYQYISDWGNLTVDAFGDESFFKDLTAKVGENLVGLSIDKGGRISVSADDMTIGADNIVKIIYQGVVLGEHIVSIRKMVGKPILSGYVTSGAWNFTSLFAISLRPTDHCWLDIDFGNGQPRKLIYVNENDANIPIRQSSFYSDLGDYVVTVDVYNEVSKSQETLDMSVEVPIITLNVSTDNITRLQDNVTVSLDVNFGIKGPRQVNFVIDWGDGQIQEHRHFNYDPVGFDMLYLDHDYVDWGLYRISVTAMNNISHGNQEVLVQVGENMTYLDILTDNERVPVGGAIVFTVNCPTGSDVMYILDLGDGTNFTVLELDGSNDTAITQATNIYSNSINVSHVYAMPGVYDVKVVAINDFGQISTSLCPKILVSTSSMDSDCQPPEVNFEISIENEDDDEDSGGIDINGEDQDDSNFENSLNTPLIVKRADTITITVDATYQCSLNGSHLTYSWKGYSFEYDYESSNSSIIKKSIFQFCGFKLKENILTITPRMLPFGLYQLSVTVSPADKDLLTTTRDYFIEVIQSDPVPHIDGDKVRTIMRYANAIFDISASHDPDLEENRRKDLSFHLFFLLEGDLKKTVEKPFWQMQKDSSLLLNRTMFHTTSANTFYLYQQGKCFNDSIGILPDISTFNGRVTFAADNFASDVFSFGVILWAERNNLTAMTSQIVEVRSSNMSLDDLGSLLDLALNADPDTAIRLCGGAASAILNQDASSADEQEKLAESTEAVVSTLGSVAKRIDSPNQASKCANAIATMTSNKDLVTEGSRSSAAGAFVSLSNGSASMQEATVDDMSSFAGEALGGMGNIFPTSAEEKKGPTRRSKDAQDEMTTVTTELLGLMATRIANGSIEDFGYTQPFTTAKNTAFTPTSTTTAPSTTTTSRTTTTTPTTTTTTTTNMPTTTTTTVITTQTTTIIHTTVGTTLSPAIRAEFINNGDNFTISGITVSTLSLNASQDNNTFDMFTTTTPYTTMTTTTEAPTTPATIPIHPRMFLPRMDERTSYEIAEDHLNSLPEKETYDELLDYIFDDCLLFRKVMKTPDIQWNCPCISAEAINMMKCDGDFSLQDRVFDIMTHYEHPDDLYEAYLRPLNKARRIRDKKRKETDKLVATSGQKALGTVADSVGSKTDEADKTERSFETPRLGMKLAKAPSNGTNSTDGGGGGGQNMAMPVGGFNMPTGALAGAGGGCSNMDTMFLGDTDNPFTYSEEKSSVGKGVLSLGYSCNGEKVTVEGTDEPIVLWMDRDANKYEHSLFVLLTNTKKDVWRNFNYHPLNITDKNSSLQVVLEPRDDAAEYYVYVKYGDRPNMTHYDFIGSAPNDDVVTVDGYEELNDTQKEQLRYSVQVPLEMTSENGTYWIGVKFKSGNIEIEEKMANTSYTLLNLLSGCRFWDDTNNSWSSEGCVVGPLTTKYKTQCLCNHLTSFGSDAAVAPNTIDFNNVWAKFDLTENAAVFSTVIALIGTYLLLMIWLRHMDKKDLIKWGALPLDDNLPTDGYHYQVTIQTGVRKHAGTESQVRFIVSGEESDTGVRRLAVAEGERKHLPRGSILNYVMSVENCLGPLTFLRIWHDNSGKGVRKSWYLDQVQINDLQTGEKFIFLCDKWLAVEQDDGMVDRILPVAGIDDLIAFKQLFSTSARKKLANDHIWFSIFSRPTRSNFTRVQRLSCCMSLLFLTMITNAMWFKGDSDQKQVEAIKLGPFSFTLAQFFISFASTLIVFPVNFIMMTFFRRCRQKNNAVGQVNQTEVKDKQKFRWKNVSSSSMVWGPRAKKSRMSKLKESVSNILSLHKKNKYEDNMDDIPEERDDDVVVTKPKKKKPWYLPHWCVYIAWVLCFFSIVSSGFFTILYSMQWGKEKANEWLTTFCLSFFQSVVIVQPIKVLLLVAFIACILKKPELEEEDLDEDINKVLAGRKLGDTRDEASLSQIMLQRRTDNSEFQPPDPEELAKAREQRLMEMKMEAVLKEIIIYFIFLGIIFFLSYQQRDPQSFVYGDIVRKNMLSGFDNIRTVPDYWKWLQGTLLPALYAVKYANGTNITYWQDAACIYDMESRRVGVARIRQLRIKNDTCTILPAMRKIINHCRDEYGWSDDDTKPYLPFWKKPSARKAEKIKDSDSPFVYQNSFKLKTAPYVGNLATYKGGGYTILTKRTYCRTKVKVQGAKDADWLDLNTKAIFLEFTVYNPNSNLFASVTALTEFLTTGNAMPRTEVKVFRLISYVGGFGLIVLIMEVFFGCFTMYFFYRCIKKLKANKIKYFNDFWNLLEFVLLCFAIACIVLYAFKHILTEVAMRALHDRKSDGFVNFNSVALYDEFYGYIMAVVVFMATIQFLKLLQFNKKMGMLGATVKLATKDLKVFSIAFILYFFAFTACAYILFGSALNTYQNVITSFESMFAFALGSFDYESMTNAQPFWGPIFFFSYIGVVYIGLMSIFLTIIGDSFTQVKENVALQANDYEIVDFMWKKLKALFN